MEKNAVVLARKAQALVSRKKEEETVREAINEIWSDSTKKTYQSLWNSWVAWCSVHNAPIQATEMGMMRFAAHLANEDKSTTTILTALTAIRHVHEGSSELAALPPASKKFKAFLQGLKKRLKHRASKKNPLTVEMLKKVIEGDLSLSQNEKSLLVWGFLTGFRSEEIVRLRISDIEEKPQGLKVSLSHSKANQEGKEEFVAITSKSSMYSEIFDWYESRKKESANPEAWLFPSPRTPKAHISKRTYARLIKRCAEFLELDPSAFAGHSTRRGLATSLAERGLPLHQISRQLRHKDPRSTMGYIEEINAFENAPTSKL